MKQFFHSLLAILMLWTAAATAQNTSPCKGKAEFQAAINGNTAGFTSVGTDLALTRSWRFGDNTFAQNVANPSHTYTQPGTYRVWQFVYSTATPNCVDSFYRDIVINPTNVNPCLGKAAFQVTNTNLTYNFFSLQSNVPLLHQCHFVDGGTSDAANPSHTYANPGFYRIVHYIKNSTANCYDSAVNEITVGNVCELLQPKFEWVRDSLNYLRIRFINQSLPNSPPVLNYKWNFGDGSTSADKNPTHTYNNAGEYSVCLTISFNIAGVTCSKTFCSVVSIVPPCTIQPNFIWSAEPSSPLKIKFTNQTPAPTANAQASWSFGDGSGSNDWNPLHTYAQPGVYNVCLKVYVSNTCVREICKQVVIRACNIEPNFSWTTDSVYPLRGVQFKNLTPATITQPTSVKWSFGDGTTSTEWSPFHKYEKAGTYNVCLRIEFFAGCVKEICKTVVIPEPVNCERFSNFNFQLTSEPNTVKFEASFNLSSLKYVWTFGDGTGSFTPATAHKYERPGKYTVCLTVYRGENCASTTCKEVTVGPLPCELTWVKYEYQRTNAAGNAIKFTAVSNQPILSQRWTIQRDGAPAPVIINANNPIYTFTLPGIYKVFLRAITMNGCVKEYCQVITIANILPVCSLQVTPNPATTQIYFRAELQSNQTVVASILDLTGVRRSVHFFNGTAGWNSFNIGIASLPVGYYTLEVKYNNQVCTTRFQKLN